MVARVFWVVARMLLRWKGVLKYFSVLLWCFWWLLGDVLLPVCYCLKFMKYVYSGGQND